MILRAAGFPPGPGCTPTRYRSMESIVLEREFGASKHTVWRKLLQSPGDIRNGVLLCYKVIDLHMLFTFYFQSFASTIAFRHPTVSHTESFIE